MAVERDVVIFGLAEWDAPLPTNQHHLARRWARGGRVLFVDTIGTRRPRLAAGDLKRIAARLRSGRQAPAKAAPSIWRISPLGPPPGMAGMRRSWLERSFARATGAALRSLGFRRPVAWFFNPRAASILLDRQADAFRDAGGEFATVVYHAVDDLTPVTGAAADEIEAGEERLADRADLLLASAPPLFDKLNARAPGRVRLLPNVADFEHFHRAAEPEARIAPAIAALPRPRILFSGNLASYKIDVELLRTLIEARPEWQWGLIGPEWAGDRADAFSTVRRLPNARFLGHVAYAALPEHLAGADALIIPYRRDAATESVCPLKFFEYLSTGKPVVAAALPALRAHERVVHLAESPDMFVQALDEALAESGGEAREARIALAREHSWEGRMEEIGVLLKSIDAR